MFFLFNRCSEKLCRSVFFVLVLSRMVREGFHVSFVGRGKGEEGVGRFIREGTL